MPAGRRQRVIDEIRRRIDAGELTPGQALPSIEKLADQLGTSPATVKIAQTVLKSLGLLRGESGVAVYVADPLPTPPTDKGDSGGRR